jgi:hypothetical protein
MPKKMTKQEILDRTKNKSYIMLQQPHIVKVVSQLTPKQQLHCFNGAKTIKPLSKVETAGILALIEGLDKIDNRPISKIPIKKRREIIKEQSGKNKKLKKFLEDNQLWAKSQIMEETTSPGDFSPSGLWTVLDGLLTALDLSKPEK